VEGLRSPTTTVKLEKCGMYLSPEIKDHLKYV
jgi:hypothetical protein